MATLSRSRLLVVDDLADAADSLASLLRLWGYAVEVAYGGAAALETARAFRPGVVLLDVAMPGVDGFRLAQCIQNEPGLADNVLIAMTGHSEEACRTRVREAGIDHYLLKPADRGQLQDLIAKLVRRPLLAPEDGRDCHLVKPADLALLRLLLRSRGDQDGAM